MPYKKHQRIVVYCDDFYVTLFEAYTHMHMHTKTAAGRKMIVNFFRSMPDSARQNLVDYHSKMNLNEYFKHGEK